MENENKIIASSRITLRPFKSSDADDFRSFASDERVFRYTPLLPVNSKEDAVSFIDNVCIPHPYFRSICVDNRWIGFVAVTPLPRYFKHVAEIGLGISREYWSKGVATIAATMAIIEAFGTFPDLVKIQCHIDLGNKAVQKVVEKIGFSREGVLRKQVNINGDIRDAAYYGILSTDPFLVRSKLRSSL